MYQEDLALNNQQRLICHKTQANPNPADYHRYFQLKIVYVELFNKLTHSLVYEEKSVIQIKIHRRILLILFNISIRAKLNLKIPYNK